MPLPLPLPSLLAVSRRVRFCAAHRLVGYAGACAHLHGHNYEVVVYASGEQDGLGMIVDFKTLGAKLGGWLDENWDHRSLCWNADSELMKALAALRAPFFSMPEQTTAENIANYLLTQVCPGLFGSGTIRRVEVKETENCVAIAELP